MSGFTGRNLLRISPLLAGIYASARSPLFFSSCAAAPTPRRPDVDLKERVVIVTGATAGIGKACAWRFAELGSRLVLIGRREEKLEELKTAIIENYPDAKVLTGSYYD
jgi:hypothetical protein